jgi:dihydroorotate dehydrogenase (NAD+) catalytic subunit
VQVGTATFANPRAPMRVLDELRAWCARHKISHLDDLQGKSHR